jgi:ribonuclease G
MDEDNRIPVDAAPAGAASPAEQGTGAGASDELGSAADSPTGGRPRARRSYRRRPRRPRKATAESGAPDALENSGAQAAETSAPPRTARHAPPGADHPSGAPGEETGGAAPPDATPAPKPRPRARGRSRGRSGGRGKAVAPAAPSAEAIDPDQLPEPFAGLDESAHAVDGEELPGGGGRLWLEPPRSSADEQLAQELAAFLAARMPEDEAGEPIATPGRMADWAAELESPPLPDAEPVPVPTDSATELQPPAALPSGPGARRRGRKPPARAERPVRPEAAPREPAPPARAAEERGREREREREPRVPRERLRKEILVNVDDRETRIAVIEDGRLVELHVEREERVVGSIYKGRVCNVLPGMDAAFVDVGLERNAFLYVGDILFEAGGDTGAPARRTSRSARIKDVARPGQEIPVQVVKGPRGTKGARVSTRISLPGRFLVLMPEGDHLGVSRKIEDAGERDRLRRLGEAMRPAGFGLIIRTEAEEKSEAELRQDLDMLQNLWKQITEKSRRTPAPALIHQDLSLILKTIRDMFGSDVDRMVLDSESEFQKAIEMLEVLSPQLKSRVHLHQESAPLFSRYNIEDEIDRLLRRKVWLRSGGHLTIDSTEALTTIDVNTGKYIGTTSLSDTILKTNLDAVGEIARQLRLRDIGGMIVIDFIDMTSPRDRQQVMRALEAALKRDRTRTKIAHISPLGLVEMTRKRTAETVTDVMTEACPYCQGRGRVWSAQTMAIQIEREIKRRCAEIDLDAVLVHASPEVAAWLIGPEGENVEQLEREVRRPIYVRARHHFHVEKYEVLPGDMLEIERQMLPFHGGQVVDCLVTKLDLIVPPRSAGWVDGYFVDLANGTRFDGQTTRVRLVDVRRSFALAEPVAPAASVDRSEPI